MASGTIQNVLKTQQVGNTITALGGEIKIFRSGNVVTISFFNVTQNSVFSAPKPFNKAYLAAPLTAGNTMVGYCEYLDTYGDWRVTGMAKAGYGSITYIAE